MAKGCIYEISQDINCLGNMNESDFDRVAGVLADYFVDDDREKRAEELLTVFKKAGFETGMEYDDSGSEWFWFRFSDESRKEYFRPRYERFSKMAAEMTLDDFSQNVYRLLDCIEDQYGDATCLNGSYYDALDYALRVMDPGVKYYVGNVVFAN